MIRAKEILKTHIPVAKSMQGVSLQEFFAGGEELSIGDHAIVTGKIHAFLELVPGKGVFPNWIDVLDVCGIRAIKFFNQISFVDPGVEEKIVRAKGIIVIVLGKVWVCLCKISLEMHGSFENWNDVRCKSPLTEWG
jgi:hypothetical protein